MTEPDRGQAPEQDRRSRAPPPHRGAGLESRDRRHQLEGEPRDAALRRDERSRSDRHVGTMNAATRASERRRRSRDREPMARARARMRDGALRRFARRRARIAADAPRSRPRASRRARPAAARSPDGTRGRAAPARHRRSPTRSEPDARQRSTASVAAGRQQRDHAVRSHHTGVDREHRRHREQPGEENAARRPMSGRVRASGSNTIVEQAGDRPPARGRSSPRSADRSRADADRAPSSGRQGSSLFQLDRISRIGR